MGPKCNYMHSYKTQAEGKSTREKAMWQPLQRERKREREIEREMQSHCFVGFEDRGKDHEPRSASYATIEAGKVISLWRECSLANTRFGARESDFRLVTSRNVRENMSTVLTHCACVLSHISQLFATPEEPIGYRSL